jgi:hypothetical protein
VTRTGGTRSHHIGVRRLEFPTSQNYCIVDPRSVKSQRGRGSVGPQVLVEDRWRDLGELAPRHSGF